MTAYKQTVARFLGWLQLIISVMLATLIFFGYLTYRVPLGQFIESFATSIASISKVVGMTAETLETRQILIVNTKQTLIATRILIKELNATALTQTNQAPIYAASARDASTVLDSIGDVVNSIGDGLMFSAPTSLQMEGIRPVIVMSRPLEPQGQLLKTKALAVKGLGSSLLNASNAIESDGAKLGKAFMATTDQALKLLDETEKTLDRLQENDLPKALQEMKSTSENLRNISQEVVNIGGSIVIVFLAFGLLLSGWCFLNSLTLLMIANQRSIETASRNET